MPMPRSLGGTNMPLSTSHTVSSAITMRPASGRSRPARQRSVVVLPQPDGPSSVISLPVSTSRLMPSTALTVDIAGRSERLAEILDGEHGLIRYAYPAASWPSRPTASAAPLHAQFKPAQAATITISGMIWMTPSAETAP